MSKRGGAREGSGPKPISKKYSDALKKDIWSAMLRKAKETNKSFGDIVAEIVYDDNKANSPLRAGALKLVQEILLIRETQNRSEVDVRKCEGPTIVLPAVKAVPPQQTKEKDNQGAALH